MPWRLVIIVVGLVGLAAAAVSALVWTRSEDGPLRLYGNVDIREVDLAFRVDGRIAEMLVEEGDQVTRGQRLAVLDRQPFEEELARARAAAAARRAVLMKLEAGTRQQEIEQARAVLAERQASLVRSEREFQRIAELVERRVVSQSAYDDARAALEEAQARVRAAQQSLDLALAGAREEDKAAARAELAAAEAVAQQATTALEDAELHAPNGGIIRTRIREPGAIVAAGAPVYTLALIEPVRIRAYVDEPDLGRIAPGQTVEVVSDSRPGEAYTGQVGFISPTAEFTPRTVQTPELRTDLVYRFHVIVDEGEGLRQGMPVTVRLPEATE